MMLSLLQGIGSFFFEKVLKNCSALFLINLTPEDEFLIFLNSLKSFEIKSNWFKSVDGQDELLLVYIKGEETRPVCRKDVSEMTVYLHRMMN